MKILMFIIMFLLIGAFFIISNENIKLDSQENTERFFKEYNNWMSNLIANSRTVLGYVIKMEWLPENG